MRQLTITVPEDRLRRIQKLLRQEPGVIVGKSKPVAVAGEAPAKKKLSRQQQALAADLKQALVDVERHQRGELKLTPMEDFLRELEEIRDAKWPPTE